MRRLFIGALASLAVLACGGAAGAGAARPAAAPAAPPAPQVEETVNATLGQVLADAEGRMLYLFMPERGGHVVCTGTCTTMWVPLLAPGTAPPSSATPLPGQLGAVDRPDGGRQVTYDQWPLYRFADDHRPGQALGEGAGGEWFAVPVDGAWGLPTPTPPPPPPPPAAAPVQQPAPPPRMQPPFNDHDRDNAGGPSDGDGNG